MIDYDAWKTRIPDTTPFLCEICDEQEAMTAHGGTDICYPCLAEILAAGAEEISSPAVTFKKAANQ